MFTFDLKNVWLIIIFSLIFVSGYVFSLVLFYMSGWCPGCEEAKKAMTNLADKVGNKRRVFHRRGKPVDVQLVRF
jgi:thiol-disulfide isomerase/thioredoxin